MVSYRAYKHTLPKFNREPENDSFQKGCFFHVPSQTLGRYMPSGNAFSNRGLMVWDETDKLFVFLKHCSKKLLDVSKLK